MAGEDGITIRHMVRTMRLKVKPSKDMTHDLRMEEGMNTHGSAVRELLDRFAERFKAMAAAYHIGFDDADDKLLADYAAVPTAAAPGDPNCKYCKGSGAITNSVYVAPCDCVVAAHPQLAGEEAVAAGKLSMTEKEAARQSVALVVSCADAYFAAVEALFNFRSDGPCLAERQPSKDTECLLAFQALNDTGKRLRAVVNKLREVTSSLAGQTHSAPGGDEQSLRDLLGDLLHIGSAARSNGTIMVNVQNLQRFAEKLDAIEREFFMVPGDADPDYPDEEQDDVCILNRWGLTTAEYVEQFRAALAALTVKGEAT